MTYSKYKKIEKIYLIDKNLLITIQKKKLFIEKTLYLRYLLLFIFDNIISCLIYIKNMLLIANIKKKLGGQQAFLQSV